MQKSNCKEVSNIFLHDCGSLDVWLWMVEAFLIGVFLGICVKCFQEFLNGISLDLVILLPGQNRGKWAKKESSN